MTVLVTADLHISANPRDAYRSNWLKKLPSLAAKHKANVVLILGDLTESKEGHSAELVNFIVAELHRLAEARQVVISQGNHDWHSSPDNPFFGFLAYIENITWISQPTPFLDGQAILLPHTADYERDWDKIDFKKYDLAFAHQTFQNAASDSGFKLSGIPLSYFPSNLQIISGDIHTPQELGNLIYVGSPYSIDFGDAAEPRILLIHDNGEIESIPCEGPQKRLVEVKSIADLKHVKGLAEGDILKVRVEIAPSDHAAWPEMAEQVRAWGLGQGYLIHLVQPIVAANAHSMIDERKAAPRKTDAQLLSEYVKHRGVDDGTAKVGLKLLG